jgi:hypothetical protein
MDGPLLLLLLLLRGARSLMGRLTLVGDFEQILVDSLLSHASFALVVFVSNPLLLVTGRGSRGRDTSR